MVFLLLKTLWKVLNTLCIVAFFRNVMSSISHNTYSNYKKRMGKEWDEGYVIPRLWRGITYHNPFPIITQIAVFRALIVENCVWNNLTWLLGGLIIMTAIPTMMGEGICYPRLRREITNFTLLN